MKNNLVMVAGLRVRSNEKGLYCLNDIHKASGGDPKDAPSRWLRLKKTDNLIDSVKKRGVRENLTSQKWLLGIETINGGSHSGVYAHELLVISYAGWIDSDFQIEVNHVFYEAMEERARKLAKENEELNDFRDGFYRMELANGMLAQDFRKIDQDVVHGIRRIIRSLKFNKDIGISDMFGITGVQPKASKTVLDYALKHVVKCINPEEIRERQRFVLKD